MVWLLGAQLRRAGDRDDAYEYFKRLHDAGHLVPTDADRAIVGIEKLFHAEVPALGDSIADAISEALLAPESVVELDDSAVEVPVRVRVEAIEVGDEGLADIVVAFFHTQKLAEKTAEIVRVLALKRATEQLDLPPPEQWEVGRGFYHFPQAQAIYVVTTEISS